MRFSMHKAVVVLGWGALLLSPQSSDHASSRGSSGMRKTHAANNYYNEDGGNNNYYNEDGGNNNYYNEDAGNNNYYNDDVGDNSNEAEGGDDNYNRKNNYENYGVATDDQYVMYNEDGEELTFDGISVMPVSCINYNGGNLIKFQLFENTNSYKCHFRQLGTFVVSIAHFMRAYFNYQALTKGNGFSLPGDAAYLNCVLIQETQYLDQPLYAKIGCLSDETVTSTRFSLHVYTDNKCTYAIDNTYKIKNGYTINGSEFSNRVSFRPPFYSCLNCQPEAIAYSFKKNNNWYDDDYINVQGGNKVYAFYDDVTNNNNGEANEGEGSDDKYYYAAAANDDANNDGDDGNGANYGYNNGGENDDKANYYSQYFQQADDDTNQNYNFNEDDGNDQGAYYNNNKEEGDDGNNQAAYYNNNKEEGDDGNNQAEYYNNNEDEGDDGSNQGAYYNNNEEEGDDDYNQGANYNNNNEEEGDDGANDQYYGQEADDDFYGNRRVLLAAPSAVQTFTKQFWNEVHEELLSRSLAENGNNQNLNYSSDVGNWNFCQRLHHYGMECDESCQALDSFRVNEWSNSDIFLLVIMCIFMAAMMLLIFAKRVKAYEKAHIYGDEFEASYPGLPPMAMVLVFGIILAAIIILARLKLVNETLVFAVVTCILLFIYMLKLTLFENRGPNLLSASDRAEDPNIAFDHMNRQLFDA